MTRKKKSKNRSVNIGIRDRNKIVEDAEFLISLFSESKANILAVIEMDKVLKKNIGTLDPFWKHWKEFVREAAKGKNG